MNNNFTVLVRKSRFEYVAICLELNVSARGADLPEVEKNLQTAIALYLEDIKEHPNTVVAPIATEEVIEFLQDTEPEWHKRSRKGLLLRPFEIHEVPYYA
ncbi:MAG: hypothetical protein V2A78_05765 [bacterium]